MSWTPAILSSIIGAIFGAASTILTSYWITYKGIELPKIELEAKKTSIEVHKLALSLSPNISVSCKSNRIDKWKWSVACASKNAGIYHANIFIETVQIVLGNDLKETLYEPGNSFTVDYPNNKKSYTATPNSEGNLRFNIYFNEKSYPNGYNNLINARITFKYKTIDSATNYVLLQFPELSTFVNDISENGSIAHTYLPMSPMKEEAF